MKLVSIFLLPLLAAATAQIIVDPTCNCWEMCFQEDPSGQYAEFHKLVQAVRGAIITYDIRGTGYMLDIADDNAQRLSYEKNLASLIAITNVSPTENPFFVTRYKGHVAYASSSKQCVSACTSDYVIQRLSGLSQGSHDSVSVGCFSIHLRMTSETAPCRLLVGQHRLVLAFTNSPMSSYTSNCLNYFPSPVNVRMAIRIGGAAGTAAYPSPNPPYDLTIPYDTNYANSLSQLLTCVRNSCSCANINRSLDRDDGDGDIEVHENGTIRFPNGTTVQWD